MKQQAQRVTTAEREQAQRDRKAANKARILARREKRRRGMTIQDLRLMHRQAKDSTHFFGEDGVGGIMSVQTHGHPVSHAGALLFVSSRVIRGERRYSLNTMSPNDAREIQSVGMADRFLSQSGAQSLMASMVS